MGIKIKHAPSAAALGGSAYTIGRAEKKRWAVDIALKQQALGLQAASIGAQAQSRAAALRQREEESKRLHGLREEELGFRREQWEDEPARQLERGLQQQKILQGQESYEYTEAQKRRRAQVIEGVNWLREQVAAGTWTAEQAEQAEQQLWALYHGIIPGLVDVGPGVQQRFDSSIATALDGSQWREESPGKFSQLGMTEAEHGKSFDANYKSVASAKLGILPTEKEVKAVEKWKRASWAAYKDIGRQTKEETARLQQKAVQDLQAIEMKTQAERRGIIAALPNAFDRIIKGQPKSRGLKKGVLAEKIYSEEDYKNTLAIATEQYSDIPPDIIKDEFDKWRAERQAVPETPEELRKGGTRQEYNRGVELGYWR